MQLEEIIAAFTGHAIWFQFDLVMLTLLFWFAGRFQHKRGIYIGMALAALAVQYSGMNTVICKNLGFFEIIIGRLPEMLPYAVMGYLLAEQKERKVMIIERPIKWLAILGFLELIVIVSMVLPTGILFEVFHFQNGYGYQGILVGILVVLTVLEFDILNIFLDSAKLNEYVKNISSYGLGIYCIHVLVGNMIKLTSNGDSTFFQCIVIYLISLVLSILIKKIGKGKLKSLVQ